MADNIDRELDWEDEIEKESDFILLPEGDYNFTVTAFERARHEGSEKLPPCNKAILTLKIENSLGEVSLKHNLFLHTKTEGMLSAFFVAIGQKKHGEKLRMNWQTVIGSSGRCKIGVREWTNTKTGETMKSNEIKKFYDPENEAPPSSSAAKTSAPAQGGAFTPGKF